MAMPNAAAATETTISVHSSPAERWIAAWAPPTESANTGSSQRSKACPPSWNGSPTQPPTTESNASTTSGAIMIRGDSCRWRSAS